jgi:hypothetical protein
MPIARQNAEADHALAEMLRKMADFVERGQASEVIAERVVRTWALSGEQVEVEYAVHIKVREAPRG